MAVGSERGHLWGIGRERLGEVLYPDLHVATGAFLCRNSPCCTPTCALCLNHSPVKTGKMKRVRLYRRGGPVVPEDGAR